MADGFVWEAVSYLPGHAVGWAGAPPMDEVGSWLSRYHTAARHVVMAGQRPGALTLADVPAILLSDDLRGIAPDTQHVVRRLAARLAADLDTIARLTTGRVVIHGDFTTDNVIATGSPPQVTGVIDFGNAHLETPLADVAYGLWRSGRPYEQASRIDVARVRAFVRGYASAAPVAPEAAAIIPVYLAGRGLQMIAKRVRAGRPDTAMLAQVQWLTAHSGAVAEAVASALA